MGDERTYIDLMEPQAGSKNDGELGGYAPHWCESRSSRPSGWEGKLAVSNEERHSGAPHLNVYVRSGHNGQRPRGAGHRRGRQNAMDCTCNIELSPEVATR